MANKYDFVNPVNTTKLMAEIKATSIGVKIDFVNSDGDNISVFTKEPLTTQEQVDLQAVVDAHVTLDQMALIQNSIKGAIEYGGKLMLEFAAENVAMGISQAGKTKEVLQYLHPVKTALDTGSLYAAMDEVDDLLAAGLPAELAPFITEARLLLFKSKIDDYLG